MSDDDRKIHKVAEFGDADDLRSALDDLMEMSGDLGDIYPSIESNGFALHGWAALIEIEEGSSYTIELFDYKPEVTA